jgi:predicted DNA-binding ribbon-helix-helix protein
MCDLYARQNPRVYESLKRSVRVEGFVTSICLERLFWRILDDFAASEGKTTPQLIARLYSEVRQRRGEAGNLTSLQRVDCTVYVGMHPENPLFHHYSSTLDPGKECQTTRMETMESKRRPGARRSDVVARV